MAEKNKVLILRLQNNLKDALFEVSNSEGQSTSNYVRNLFQDDLRRNHPQLYSKYY